MNTIPTIVGILNVTPDSFYDGGHFASLDAAVIQAKQLLDDGADIIDIGGESTFVDRDDVSEDEELSRTIPLIEAIKRNLPDTRISIDTYKSSVAKQAVDAGAYMVNDVTAGRGDSAMLQTVAELNVPLVLMYAKDETSRTTMDTVEYDDVISTITEFLQQRKAAAKDAGVDPNNIILDPGLGFFVSAEPKYSYEIIARLEEFADLGCPVYISPSRKSFLAGPDKLPPAERLPGTIVASAVAAQNGASYIRTHDPKEVRRGIEVICSIELECYCPKSTDVH